jgi:peptidoglycan/LPS O-acetylase OafA/YrhL
MSISTVHRTGRSDGVDILRFLAMCIVVAQHCNLMPFGWVGVWLFYVISGFVVTKSLQSEEGTGRVSAILLFYKRRVARIIPSYLLFILVAVGVLWMVGNPPPAPEVSDFLTFNANVRAATSNLWRPEFPMSHLWTISVEMKFYAAVGIFLIVLDRKWATLLLASLLVLCPLARLIFDLKLGGQAAQSYLHHLAVFQADAFAAGGLMALWAERLNRRLGAALAVVGCVAMAAYVAVYMGFNAAVGHASGMGMVRDVLSGDIVGQFREVVIYIPLVILFSGLVCLAYLQPIRSAAAARVAAWGRASYSGYLWHFAVIVAVQAVLGLAGLKLDASWGAMPGKALLFVISLLLLIPLSMALHGRVERFGARGVNWLTDELTRRLGRLARARAGA